MKGTELCTKMSAKFGKFFFISRCKISGFNTRVLAGFDKDMLVHLGQLSKGLPILQQELYFKTHMSYKSNMPQGFLSFMDRKRADAALRHPYIL